MSDNTFVVDEKPKNKRIIGRVYNVLDPSADQAGAPSQQEIGRVSNALHPSMEQTGVPIQQEIGRINNALHPCADEKTARKPIGMLNSELVDGQ